MLAVLLAMVEGPKNLGQEMRKWKEFTLALWFHFVQSTAAIESASGRFSPFGLDSIAAILYIKTNLQLIFPSLFSINKFALELRIRHQIH